MSETKPFFIQQLLQTTHLAPRECNLVGVQKLMGTRIKASTHPGNNPEVSLMALCAARQLDMDDATLGEWTGKFCTDVMRGSVTPEDIDRAIGTIPDHDGSDANMAWFKEKAGKLGIRV